MSATPANHPRAQRTRERLIEAAGAVFASRGYRGATMREIAERADANLAAAHYHFGSKQELYREVARECFERLEARLAAHGTVVPQPAADAGRDALVELLRVRVGALLATVLDPQDRHATLMLREMADPSAMLPFMVQRWIDPLRRDTERILAALAPGLDAAAIARCTRSVVPQGFFYRSHRAALLRMMGLRAYPAGFVDEVADHIVDFTLGGLEALARSGSRRTPRPRRARRAR